MTISALPRIERLLDAGATVVGDRPECSPSLADDPVAFAARVRPHLGAPRAPGVASSTGDLAAALDELGIAAGARDRRARRVRPIARVVDGRRVTFLANPSDEPIDVPDPRAGGIGALWSAWDPVAATRRAASLVRRSTGTVFEVDASAVRLAVRACRAASPRARCRAPSAFRCEGEWTLELPGSDRSR